MPGKSHSHEPEWEMLQRVSAFKDLMPLALAFNDLIFASPLKEQSGSCAVTRRQLSIDLLGPPSMSFPSKAPPAVNNSQFIIPNCQVLNCTVSASNDTQLQNSSNTTKRWFWDDALWGSYNPYRVSNWHLRSNDYGQDYIRHDNRWWLRSTDGLRVVAFPEGATPDIHILQSIAPLWTLFGTDFIVSPWMLLFFAQIHMFDPSAGRLRDFWDLQNMTSQYGEDSHQVSQLREVLTQPNNLYGADVEIMQRRGNTLATRTQFIYSSSEVLGDDDTTILSLLFLERSEFVERFHSVAARLRELIERFYPQSPNMGHRLEVYLLSMRAQYINFMLMTLRTRFDMAVPVPPSPTWPVVDPDEPRWHLDPRFTIHFLVLLVWGLTVQAGIGGGRGGGSG